MIFVLANNEPAYIEDFRSAQPDWANGNDANGDPGPETDWLPAFKRAAYDHLVPELGDSLRFQHTYQRLVLVGRSRFQYKLSNTLDLFGIRLQGLYPGVQLYFDQGTDGIHIHYPRMGSEPGTSFDLPKPVKDYGGECTLANLSISGVNIPPHFTQGVGTRGIIIQRASLLESVAVSNFGWHAFHVTADHGRTTGDIDGAISNANGTTLLHCSAFECGHAPGIDPRRVTPANPTGYRPFGSGLRLEGQDTNVCYTRSFNGTNCARWAIDDVGYLGNRHDLPQCANCYHDVTQWETDISTYGSRHQNAIPGEPEERDFRTYNVPTGNRVQFGYHIENANARSILLNPYVEGAHPPPIVDVRAPSFVIGGIDGEDTRWTKRISSGGLTNEWRFTGYTAVKKPDETWLSESDPSKDPNNLPLPPHGVFISLCANAENRVPYRLKYIHFKDDDQQQAEQSDHWAGFFRLDRDDKQIALALTGGSSYEKTAAGGLSRKLQEGSLILPSHYRVANYTHFRKVEYGAANDLASIELALIAADRQVGDAYICLQPVAGGVYEATVIEDPHHPGTKIWAEVSHVQM